MASVFCAGCQKNYAVPPGMAGRTVRCKACGGNLAIAAEPASLPPVPVLPVPAEPVAAIPVEFDPGEIPLASSAAVPPPLPPRKPPAVWPTQPPPAYKPFQPPPPAFSIGFDFNRWKILPLVLAAILLGFGINEWAVSADSTATPQPITCKTLETVGCGKNHHVRLTDFSALRFYYVDQKDQPSQYELVALVAPTDVMASPGPKRSAGRRAGAKIADEDQVRGSAIRVFLKTTDLRQPTDFMGVVNRPYIDGMIGGPLDTIPSGVSSILGSHYPGLNTSRCIILEEGKTPRSGLGLAMTAGGALLLVVAIGLFFVKYE